MLRYIVIILREVMHMYHGHGFDWSPRMFENNALEYMVLDYLKEKSGHGHDIANAIKERSWGFFSPGLESVHQTLKMLVDMGYVNRSDKDGEKVYTITGEGKEYLKKRQEMFHSFKRRMQERFGGMEFAGGFRHHRCGMWA